MSRNPDRPTVGIDLRGLEPGFKAHFGRGTGRYAEGLSNALFAEEAHDVRLKPLGTGDLSGSRIQQQVLKAAPLGKETLRAQLFLPSAMARSGCELIHFLAHGDAPARSRIPYIVTVLDLIPLRFPELYKPKRADWRFKLARGLELKAIRGALGVLAISEATKRDVVSLLGVPEERIIVTPLAPFGRPTEPAAEDLRAARRNLSLGESEPILLYVGGIDARKNVSFLLKVFRAVLADFDSRSGGAPNLVLAGAYEADARYPALVREIEALGLSPKVRLAGFVSDRELAALYRIAALKVFPSLYEGFGFPVLEAMQAGLPVVAGRNSSIPEVAGNAAVLLPDNDAEVWVREISELLRSAERRDVLRDAGVERAKLFSWARTAERTLEGYRRALGLKSQP